MPPVFRLGDPATAYIRPLPAVDSDSLAREPDLKTRCRHLFNNEFESDIVFVVGKPRSPVKVSLIRRSYIIFRSTDVIAKQLQELFHKHCLCLKQTLIKIIFV